MSRPKRERLQGNMLREGLRAEQNNRCYWCGAEMEDAAFGYPRPPLSVTLDHVTERFLGGELSRENCVAACHACNALRADIFNGAYWRIRKLFDGLTKRMSARQIVEHLGSVARELEPIPAFRKEGEQ